MKRYLYILIFIISAQSVSANLPDGNKTVFTYMHTDKASYISGDYILLKLYCFDKNNKECRSNNAMYIDLVSANNEFVCGQILELISGETSGIILIPDTLKTGSYKLRAYTQQAKQSNTILCTSKVLVTNRFKTDAPFFSDTLFTHSFNESKLKNNHAHAAIELNDTVFNKREKVEVNFIWSDLSKTGLLNGSLYVKSVSKSKFHTNTDKLNICEAYQEKIPPSSMETSHSESYNERCSIMVSGNITHELTGNYLQNYAILIAQPDSVVRVKYAISDSLGNFSFLLPPFYGSKRMYFSVYTYPNMKLYSQANISIDSKFIQSPILDNIKRTISPTQVDSLSIKKAIIAKAYNNKLFVAKEISNTTITFEQKYLAGNNLKTVYLDDYIELPNFKEICKEVLSFVRFRENSGVYTFYINDGINNIVRENPMIFVDGVPLSEVGKLLDWGSNKIKSVQVQIEPRYYGDIPFENGLIFIWTKHHDFWKTYTLANTYVNDIMGFQNKVDFIFPEYNDKIRSTLPDFRQVIYWNPNFKINSNNNTCSFYTSDETGLFELIFQGITQENEPVYLNKFFRVSK